MIVTVTPNPSLDRAIVVPQLERGAVVRADHVHLDPGGKGVNVARVLAGAGVSTVAVLPTGGPEGTRLAELLAQHAVPVAAVPIAGTTRSNITIVESDGTTTKLNEPGPELTPAELTALHRVAAQHGSNASWIVCCGSVPPGAPDDFHARLVRSARHSGVPVAVDASGPALAEACKERPNLIKPNRAELAELIGVPLPRLGDVVLAAQRLRAHGVGAVLVSLDRDGALLVDEFGTHHAVAPEVAVRSTVGAGDAALAGFLLGGAAGVPALRSAVAHGSAAVRLPGSRMPAPHEVDIDRVRVVELDLSLLFDGAAA